MKKFIHLGKRKNKAYLQWKPIFTLLLLIFSISLSSQTYNANTGCSNQTLSNNNPTFNPDCNGSMNVILILDESGSIGVNTQNETDVENGVLSFMNGLEDGTVAVNVAIVEFANSARQADINNIAGTTVGYLPLTQNLIDNGITNYLQVEPNNESNSNEGSYNPNGSSTDYSDAFDAASVAALANADLIIFFTDGGTSCTDINDAIIVANTLKSGNTKIFGVGVAGVNNGNNVEYLKAVTGLTQWDGMPGTFAVADFAMCPNFSNLVVDLGAVGSAICPASCDDCKTLACDGSVGGCDDGTNANGVRLETECSNCGDDTPGMKRACAEVAIDLTSNPDWIQTGGVGCTLDFDVQENGNFDFYVIDNNVCSVPDCNNPDFTVDNNATYTLPTIPPSGMVSLIVCKDGGSGRRNLSVTLNCCEPAITCPPSATYHHWDIPWVDMWLASATTELCGMTGTTVVTDFDLTDFDPCATDTKTITFTLLDASGNTLATCTSDLTLIVTPLNAHCARDKDVSCFNGSDGQVSVTAIGGTPPYSYLWQATGTNSSTNQVVSGLPAGLYSVTATDANGCTKACSAQVNQPATAVDAQCARDADASCYGASDGQVSVTAVGGTPPYTYLWQATGTNSSTAQVVSGLPAGLYFVTATDSKGCTEACAAQVNNPTASITCPNPGTFDCGDVAGINGWLASYTTNNVCADNTITTNYNPNDFDKCATITKNITFSVKTPSGQTIADCVTSLTINAAPPAVVTFPVIPNPISCVEADGYMAPVATFSNGLMGDCSNSGTLVPIVTNSWDACGGTLVLSYNGEDACGNEFFNGGNFDITIVVDPAPEATVTPPTFPSTISCVMAQNFSAANATYTNGLTGNCLISGSITPNINAIWDVCGGLIIVSYFKKDACDRDLVAGPFIITVDPAPEATVTPPTFPTSISCEMAQSFSAANATYTNGLTGNCLISGSISADVTPAWNSCGGMITVNYGGPNLLDPCGRPISAGPFVIMVDAAPEATVTPPSFPTSNISCAAAMNFTASNATYTNGLSGNCTISGSIVATVTPVFNSCGGIITVVYNDVDACGRPISAGPFTITVDPATEATIAVPALPTSLSCTMAATYIPPTTTYNNNENGVCNISGTLNGSVTPNFTACGGTLTINYTGEDICGRPLSAGPYTIAVDPAPEATIFNPSFPSNISCEAGFAYQAPFLSYTNGLTGVCEISGTLDPIVVPAFTKCGGTITIDYLGLDQCGNIVHPGPYVITVNPAPEATLTVPNLSTPISCATADGYSPPNATYTNGLTGPCEISGSITATVIPNWTVCGGFIVVDYNGMDECNRPFHAGPFVIIVEPAPEATVTPPTFPSSISCAMAENFSAANATYTNGLTGDCEISGTIPAAVTPAWTICGGTITINYGGPNLLDPCDRPISAGPFVINVEAAPEATVTAPTFPSTISCVMAENFSAANATYTNGLTGVCEISGTITADVVPAWDVCGGTITINYGGPNLLDPCGRPISAGPFVINVEAAPEATVTAPTFPTSISCVTAETFTAANATYTNGLLSATCNIFGTITATVTPAWDACGGTITINYSSTDQCGRTLAAGPFVITVDPAPEATPVSILFLNPLSCEQGFAFQAPNLPYSNNLSGACNISGTITPTVTNSFTKCGGTITIEYTGQDQCGRPLHSGPFVIQVLPAPEATIFTPPSFPSNISCEAGFAFQAPILSYTNGLTGACNISGNLDPIVINAFTKCGGTITVDYVGEDECGRVVHPGPFVITVDPAPEATVTAPVFSTPITCEEAFAFSAPNATYTNGLTGACEISGEITATVVNSFDKCGGTITVSYLAEDDCARILQAGPFVIDVTPAPEATVTAPTFPTNISCVMAETFVAGNATYTNGLTGSCNISGTIQPNVTNNWSECGGTIMISYMTTDACNRPLSAGPFTIIVDPAPAATVTAPVFPSPISCAAAEAFVASNATYTNGITGACNISGTLAPTVVNDWTLCGGTITVSYSGQDQCGRALTAGPFVITVDPTPEATVSAPTFPTTITCVQADNFVAGIATYTNSQTGVCEITGTINPTVDNNWNVCGGTITVSYTAVDPCGRALTAGPFTINVLAAPEATLTPPPFSSPMACVTAEGFSPADATYTNGLPGTCNISGTITADVFENWDACGGTISYSYTAVDPCGRFIQSQVFTIVVQPAPVPTITLPPLPTSVSCEDATIYVPPTASYSNGLAGACNLSGTATSLVNHFYDACGGTLQIIYMAEDDCGRSIPKNIAIIPVNPAPTPTILVPTFPTSLSCSDAQAFEAPYTPYDNGLTGVCNISGIIQPSLSYNVDECNGGTMTIQYHGADDCGNLLHLAPIVIQVEPASLPTLELPAEMPHEIYCWEAAYFDPGNATYNNGELGFCQNAGEIEAVIEEYWNNCDGGYIIANYEGYDNCGNYLPQIKYKVFVMPDTWGPVGECKDYEETIIYIDQTPGPDKLDDYKDQIASSFVDYCGEIIVTVVGDTGAPICDVDGTFERIYSMQISDECGNITDTCSLIFSGACNPNYCTLNQSFYANPNDSLFGFSSVEIIDSLIDFGNDPISIGGGDCGFEVDDALCIQTIISGNGESINLPDGYTANCWTPVNNALVNQVIITEMNVRYNKLFNPEGSLDFGAFQLSAACMHIPAFILDSLPDNANVNDLLDYANDYLACSCDTTCGNFKDNMAELTGIFLGLNSRFNKCHKPGPCFNVPDCYVVDESSLIEFDTKQDEYSTDIIWMMSEDSFVDLYEVEKSTDGSNFTVIEKVIASKVNTTTQYSAKDNNPNEGDNFYRLKVTSSDGEVCYSAPRQEIFKSTKTTQIGDIKLYPNPSNQFINLDVNDFLGMPAVIEIFDNRGQKIGEKNFQPIDQRTLEIDIQDFAGGLYWISITVEGHDQITKKFIVKK